MYGELMYLLRLSQHYIAGEKKKRRQEGDERRKIERKAKSCASKALVLPYIYCRPKDQIKYIIHFLGLVLRDADLAFLGMRHR